MVLCFWKEGRVPLLLGRLLRPGGGLGDLVCQAGFAEPDSFCLSCSPAQRVTIPYSHVATGYGHIHVWSADQQDLHSISVAEDAVESYIPSGIDVGIDFGKVETPCTPTKNWLLHYANLKDCSIGWE